MKDIYLLKRKDLATHYPTCKFLGRNKILQSASLENCRVENCRIEAPVNLENLSIKNAIVSLKKIKKKKIKKNYFLSQKYFNFLLNFDKNFFDDIKITVICSDAHICDFANNLFETLHAQAQCFQVIGDFTNEATQQTILQKCRGGIGFWLDDRAKKLWAINPAGQILNGDEILYLLAWWLNNQNRLFGEVVGTNLTNLGIENKLRALNLTLQRINSEDFSKAKDKKSCILAGSQEGVLFLKWNGQIHGALLAMRMLASIYLENKNIWLRVKENKYVQVCKVAHNAGPVDFATLKTFVDFYTLKLKNQGRVNIWQSGQDLSILVECMDKTTAAVLALDIKKKILKILKK